MEGSSDEVVVILSDNTTHSIPRYLVKDSPFFTDALEITGEDKVMLPTVTPASWMRVTHFMHHGFIGPIFVDTNEERMEILVDLLLAADRMDMKTLARAAAQVILIGASSFQTNVGSMRLYYGRSLERIPKHVMIAYMISELLHEPKIVFGMINQHTRAAVNDAMLPEILEKYPFLTRDEAEQMLYTTDGVNIFRPKRVCVDIVTKNQELIHFVKECGYVRYWQDCFDYNSFDYEVSLKTFKVRLLINRLQTLESEYIVNNQWDQLKKLCTSERYEKLKRGIL